MNALIIYAHPNPASFNNAMKERIVELLEAQGEVRIHDLYSMKFDPVLDGDDFAYYAQKRVPPDIEPIQADITWAQFIVVLFPTWWAGMPAILKGYLDRTLTNGFAYAFDAQGSMQRPLAGRRVAIFQTAGMPRQWLGHQIQAFETVANDGIFGYVGWEIVAHKLFDSVPKATSEQRNAWLAEVSDVVKTAVGIKA